MTESIVYLRLKKRRSVNIPALARLVAVFCQRFGVDTTGSVHKQISDVVTAMVGRGRVVEGGHKWWIVNSPDMRLYNLLSVLSDLGAYDVIFEEK